MKGQKVNKSMLQKDRGFFLGVFGRALTTSQTPFELLRHALIAMLAHWPEVNFNKLISELQQKQQMKHTGGKIWRKRATDREDVLGLDKSGAV